MSIIVYSSRRTPVQRSSKDIDCPWLHTRVFILLPFLEDLGLTTSCNHLLNMASETEVPDTSIVHTAQPVTQSIVNAPHSNGSGNTPVTSNLHKSPKLPIKPEGRHAYATARPPSMHSQQGWRRQDAQDTGKRATSSPRPQRHFLSSELSTPISKSSLSPSTSLGEKVQPVSSDSSLGNVQGKPRQDTSGVGKQRRSQGQRQSIVAPRRPEQQTPPQHRQVQRIDRQQHSTQEHQDKDSSIRLPDAAKIQHSHNPPPPPPAPSQDINTTAPSLAPATSIVPPSTVWNNAEKKLSMHDNSQPKQLPMFFLDIETPQHGYVRLPFHSSTLDQDQSVRKWSEKFCQEHQMSDLVDALAYHIRESVHIYQQSVKKSA